MDQKQEPKNLRAEIKTPLLFISDDSAHILVLPFPSNVNDRNYDRIRKDMERILWFSKGHDGVDNPSEGTMTFSFEPEEYNCVLRYLTQFEWKKIDSFCFSKPECPYLS
jgi:hypothetical protein